MASFSDKIRKFNFLEYLPAKDFGQKYDKEYQAKLDASNTNEYIGEQKGQFLAYWVLLLEFFISMIFFHGLQSAIRKYIGKRY